ncbi:glycosyltransferase involved in cell wall biosynthesis [Dysgonomonas hofstadii]|uniref:Glycosyltransferase involved in cell wall biosynthesis n=1 Tax=Dysgonomonas hofstadii TaxID=637886 RepID=A0A840CMH6_9BACT|nr:glycosyltransferase family 4 protein [Dysgonomonas hofstadii]MBB4035899.1 glycosyltransferase involved in cell wall biosynthesis [Dysgonomonas hofstadii]
MKRILYFMPKLELKNNAGNVTRVISLLRYFKNRGFYVDYFGIKNWVNETWTDDMPDRITDAGFADRVLWADLKPPKTNPIKRFFTYKIPEFILRRYYGASSIFRPFCTFYLRKSFEKVLAENEYDYIIINYILWTNLIRYSKHLKNAKVMVDTHDFLTVHVAKDKKRGKKVGDYFQTEMESLSCFDEVWAVSTDEMYVFSQFVKNAKVRLVPNMPLFVMNKGEYDTKNKEYDIVYVASDNQWNRMSVKWFLSEVYPLLPGHLKICIVGKINVVIEEEYPNVEKIPFAADLGDVYAKSRISICPMLEGTGIKLKVLEAFSFGLPVVCTQRGLDGLPNKLNNGCLLGNTPPEFADNIIRLLTDEQLYNEQSKQGYHLFDIYFNPEVRYKQLDEIFDVK